MWPQLHCVWCLSFRLFDFTFYLRLISYKLYMFTLLLSQVQKEMITNPNATDLPRERWDTWDPMLISEGLFSAANIFSSLKLVYIFSVNPHLGPLQVSLSRMVMDIMKFFFLYVLVLFAFGSGLNQLLW